LLCLKKSFKQMFLKPLFDFGRLFYHHLKFLLCDGLQNAGFYGFNAVQTRLVGSETLNGSNAVTFKEKLRGNFFTVIVYPGTQTTFFNEIHFFANFPFLQKDGSRRNFFLFKVGAEYFPVVYFLSVLFHFTVFVLGLPLTGRVFMKGGDY